MRPARDPDRMPIRNGEFERIALSLDAYNVDLAGKHAVVVGRSPILGKPIAALLLSRDATVTVCHSKTADLPQVVRTADTVVAAVGRPNFVRGAWIKPGAVVIDAGCNEGNVGEVASCVSRLERDPSA
jgi:methylenetetrahydrofolate dehydrogenase (NADP+)/methenyltetrahydrofolate cyclohydrolase